jgi:hypothetical protein
MELANNYHLEPRLDLVGSKFMVISQNQLRASEQFIS